MPQQTAEREVLEETGVTVRANELIAVRFTLEEVWCIFNGEYVSGNAISDGMENEEAVFIDVNEALISDNVVDTTKELIKTILDKEKAMLKKSTFINKKFDDSSWQLFI